MKQEMDIKRKAGKNSLSKSPDSFELDVKGLGLSEPDPLFKSPLVSLFICRVMRSGKKSLAKKIVYVAFRDISIAKAGSKWRKRIARKIVVERGLPKTRSSVRAMGLLALFERAVLNVVPSVKVLEKKRGRTVLYSPRRARSSESIRYALKWIVSGSEKRSGKVKAKRLSQELRGAMHRRGAAWVKKKSVYRLATANRFFYPRRKKRRFWKGKPARLGLNRGKYRVWPFRADWPDYWRGWNKQPRKPRKPVEPKYDYLVGEVVISDKLRAQLLALSQVQPDPF
jgi:small subunit ribosomal protein S7